MPPTPEPRIGCSTWRPCEPEADASRIPIGALRAASLAVLVWNDARRTMALILV